MTVLAVIADDLTGALDTAAPFAMRGMRTAIALSPSALGEALRGSPDVVGVSTASREIDPGSARTRVSACVAALPKHIRIFKKVDSRLKGNIAAELDAIAYRRAIVCPAIPAFGRWVRNGKLGGRGVAQPIDIAAVLGAHASAAIIPDVTTQDELEAALAQEADLLVGARALGEAVAKQLARDGRAPAIRLPAGPVLCVIGSTDPVTQGQVDHLCRARPDLTYVSAVDGVVVHMPPSTSPLTLLHATPGSGRQSPTAVARRLGDAVRGLGPAPGTLLVLSGGATAQAVLQQINIKVLDLVGEILPGLPIARAGAFTIVTKSGSFGKRDALSRMLGYLSVS